MKFSVKNKTGENIINLMRALQYHFMGSDPDKTQLNFVYYLAQDPYPRFHVYLRENQDANKIIFNLHLDQKKPSYKGAVAHSGDYEGEVLEKEAERIKAAFQVPKTP